MSILFVALHPEEAAGGRFCRCLATALNPGMCQETLSEGGGNEPKSVIVFLKERCYNAFAFCDESVKKIA